MPTYVYKFVDSGETIEVQQAFTDPTLTELAHPSDGVVRPVKKVFTPVGVTFKGSGFYKTDSRGGSSKSASSTTGSSSSSSPDSTSASTAGTKESSGAPSSAAGSGTSGSSTSGTSGGSAAPAA
jgi:predicted nucleic acid-binding Zn ribbon protein